MPNEEHDFDMNAVNVKGARCVFYLNVRVFLFSGMNFMLEFMNL